ncbi:MAG: hypothetical protein L0332_10110 [Chloroflexi bacterium]|nr:hypothetical protein [Chloroflexota bacterium]MCI0574906.1 hypothetical protein [Chloroflexota bacterium]MCI0647079.1 hypothetical protein [Chloroflexota bacterium]MCI0727059.1 hypothetical protein [Chloroflexota bacterium]
MPYQDMPFVCEERLRLPAGRPIRVGSPAWFAWLDQANHFSYQPPSGNDRLTFRKEKRRHGWYWYAYLKRDRKLYNAYAGRSATLTSDRLQQLGRQLLAKARKGHKRPP